MKKLLIFSLSLAAFSGVASAATALCNPTGATVAYTESAGSITPIGGGASLTSCEIGDKIFSNFGGTMDSVVGTLTVAFTGGGTGPYNETISDSSGAQLNESNFTFDYTIAVDLGTNPLNFISAMSAGGVATFTPVASNSNTTNGAGCATLTWNAPGAAVNCTLTASPTSVAVVQTYAFSSGSNTVNAIQDSFIQGTNVVNTGSPEPVSMMLLGSGLLAVALMGRKKLSR